MWRFGRLDRRHSFIDYIHREKVAFAGLQETIRTSFISLEMNNLGGATDFG